MGRSRCSDQPRLRPDPSPRGSVLAARGPRPADGSLSGACRRLSTDSRPPPRTPIGIGLRRRPVRDHPNDCDRSCEDRNTHNDRDRNGHRQSLSFRGIIPSAGPAAFAHGLEAVPGPRPRHLVHQAGHQDAPLAPRGCPSAMAPPLTLTLLPIGAGLRQPCRHHPGERLVHLEEVDVVEPETGLLEHLEWPG